LLLKSLNLHLRNFWKYKCGGGKYTVTMTEGGMHRNTPILSSERPHHDIEHCWCLNNRKTESGRVPQNGLDTKTERSIGSRPQRYLKLGH
jgi:hypothetical protein